MLLLGVGSICGSILFSVGNYFIENEGGFLRKFALRSNFLRRELKRRETMRYSVRGSTRNSTRYSRVSKRNSTKAYGSLKAAHRKSMADEANALKLESKHPEGSGVNGSIRKSLSNDSECDEQNIGFASGSTDDLHDDLFDLKEEKAIIESEFRESKSDASVGTAIWLGILIDSFPESLVIGLLTKNGVSLTFIIGVFLSNFPEALSSTVIMKRGGFSNLKIMAMWLSITLITGIGAILGAVFFRGEHTVEKEIGEKFVEGLAAGAMLVMIAETALPEAFRHAGNLVGFSTLFGFLVAYVVKLVEVLL